MIRTNIQTRETIPFKMFIRILLADHILKLLEVRVNHLRKYPFFLLQFAYQLTALITIRAQRFFTILPSSRELTIRYVLLECPVIQMSSGMPFLTSNTNRGIAAVRDAHID